MRDLNSFNNQKLEGVYGLVYFESDSKSISYEMNDIMKYLLIFEKDTLLIECDEMGVGLNFSLSPKKFESIDMGGNGELRVIDFSDNFIFKKVVGMKVSNTKVIMNCSGEVGFSIYYSNNENNKFLNLGDELYLYKELPPPLIDEGYFEV